MGAIPSRTRFSRVFRAIFLPYVLILFLAGLIYIATIDYLLFHLIVELSFVIISINIGITAIHTSAFTKNDFFHFLGLGLICTALLEFLHMLTFKGMNIFLGLPDNISTQFWLASHLVLSCSFLGASLLIGRSVSRKTWRAMTGILFFSTVLLFISIFPLQVFPAAYIDGQGLTYFKIGTEYLIIAAFLSSLIIIHSKRRFLDRQVYSQFSLAICLLIVSEGFLSRYVTITDQYNFLGHIFLTFAAFFIYSVLIAKTLKEPMALLFRELKEAHDKLSVLSERDGLTNLYNHRFSQEQMGLQFAVSERLERPFSVIMIDIDDFKSINDTYGHIAGDTVLRELSDILRDSFRSIDIIGRYGGDEFIICPLEADQEIATSLIKKVMERLSERSVQINAQTECRFTISAGVGTRKNEKTLSEVIEKADRSLLISKSKGKNRVTASRALKLA